AAGKSEIGQGGERGFRRAEAVDQVAKSGRTDILGADQPQPVEPLPVGQEVSRRRPPAHLLEPIFDSVPAASRSIFARCLTKTMMLIAARMEAWTGNPRK